MTIAELLVKIGVDPKDLEKGLGGAEKSIAGFGGRLKSAGAGLSLAVTAPILAIGGASIKMAMDAVESENLFKESYKGMADQARAWSVETSKALGLNQYELRKTSSTFFVMFDAMGLGKDAGLEMSKSLSTLSYDFASFYNLKPEEAFTKLKAGIMGQTEPLAALGIIVDEATVKAFAYKNGIAEQGATLTSQQKVLARYGAIMAQTSTAQGDLGRTLDSPTNKLRVLKEKASEAAVTFGMALLPMADKVITVMGNVATWVGTAATWFAKLPGSAQGMVVAFGGILAAAGPVLVIVGSMASGLAAILPWFAAGSTAATVLGGALAILTGPVGLVIGAIAALAVGVRYMAGSWDPVIIVAKAVWAVLGNVASVVWDLAKAVGGDILTAFRYMGDAIGWVATKAGEAFEWLAQWVPMLGNVKSALSGAATGAWDYIKGLAGVAGGQTTVTGSAVAAGGETKKLGAQYKAGADMANFLTSSSAGLAAGTGEVGKAAKKAAEDMREFVAELRGAKVYEEAKKWLAGITAVGGATKLTADQQRAAGQAVDDAIEKYTVMGVKAPAAVLATAMALTESATAAKDAATGIDLLGANIDKTAPKVEDMGKDLNTMSLAMRGLGAGAGTTLSLPTFKGTVESSKDQDTKAAGVAAGTSLTAGMGDYLKTNAPGAIIKAFQGGGDVAKTIGGGLGEMLGKNVATKLGGQLTGKLGGVIGGALGSVIPGLGTLVGGMVGSVAGKAIGAIGGKIKGLFGGGGGEAKEVKAAQAEVLKSMPNIRDQAAKAGISVDKLFSTKKMADFKAELEKVQAALGAQESKTNDLKDAMQRYGIEASQMGAAFNQEGTTNAANQILKDFQLLSGAMKDPHEAIIAIGPALGGVVHEALKMGTTIPASLKGVVAQAIEAGTMVDQFGDKFTDISQIPFETTIGEGIASIATEIAKIGPNIVAALNGTLPEAGAAVTAFAASTTAKIGAVNTKPLGEGLAAAFQAGDMAATGFGSKATNTIAALNGKPIADTLSAAFAQGAEAADKMAGTSQGELEKIKADAIRQELERAFGAGTVAANDAEMSVRDVFSKMGDRVNSSVKDKLIAAFRKGKDEAGDFVNSANAKLSTIKTDIEVNFTGHVNVDGAPPEGFATGTKAGGGWFRNFSPQGEPVIVHGREAIVRADQAVPFAMDVLRGVGVQGYSTGTAPPMSALPAVDNSTAAGETNVIILGIRTQGEGESMDAMLDKFVDQLPAKLTGKGRVRLALRQVLS